MTLDEIDDFTARYFEDWTLLRSGSRAQRLALEEKRDRPSERLDMMLANSDQTEVAWPIILALVDRAPDDEALAFVAAGPLEDLVRRHPDQFGDRLLDQARRDGRLRQALVGIWGWEDVPEPLRGRLLELVRPPT